MKNMKIIIAIFSVLLIALLGILITAYSLNIEDYKEMENLPVGYSHNGEIAINENIYNIASFDFDSSEYLFKGIDESNPYHIITSKIGVIAAIRDFVVYPSIDDPNGYTFTKETDSFGVGIEYFSENIDYPDCRKNTVRQLLIVFAPLSYPSSGYTLEIDDKEAINKILDCIEKQQRSYLNHKQ